MARQRVPDVDPEDRLGIAGQGLDLGQAELPGQRDPGEDELAQLVRMGVDEQLQQRVTLQRGAAPGQLVGDVGSGFITNR